MAELQQIPKDWWRDRIAIVELLDWLIDDGQIVTASDARHVVEKPWRYTTELALMLTERALEEARDRDPA